MAEQDQKTNTPKPEAPTKRSAWFVFFKFVVLPLFILAVVFVLHVPLLKLFSNADYWPEATDHWSIEKGMKTEGHIENLRIDKVFKGSIHNLWYYPSEQSFFIYARLTDELGFKMYKFTKDGRLGTVVDPTEEQLENFHRSDQFTELPTTYDSAHRYSHGFYSDKGVFTLDHFEFQKFHWPYFSYFLLKLGFNWDGMAYVSMNFEGHKLSFKIPTTYSSYAAYMDGGLAAYLYYTPIDVEGHPYKLGLFTVSEGSYSRPMSGADRSEIHRPGYGVYLMSLKQDGMN